MQIDIFPYSVFYIFFEQYLDIWETALINIGIALGIPQIREKLFFRQIEYFLTLFYGITGAIFIVCVVITSRFCSNIKFHVSFKLILYLCISPSLSDSLTLISVCGLLQLFYLCWRWLWLISWYLSDWSHSNLNIYSSYYSYSFALVVGNHLIGLSGCDGTAGHSTECGLCGKPDHVHWDCSWVLCAHCARLHGQLKANCNFSINVCYIFTA